MKVVQAKKNFSMNIHFYNYFVHLLYYNDYSMLALRSFLYLHDFGELWTDFLSV